MSTLHLIDANSPQARPTTLALLRATADAEANARVLLLGPPGLARAAASARIDRAERIGVPGGRAELGLAALRRALRRFGEPTVICAWSAGAVRAARWLRPRTPCVVCVTQRPDRAMCRAVARTGALGLAHRHPLAVAALDPLIATSLHRQIAPLVQVPRSGDALNSADGVALPAPGLGAEARTCDAEVARWREELRARWGSDRVEPAERVVALLSDPPEAADAQRALLLVGLIRETLAVRPAAPPRLAVLVHPAQHRRHRAEEVLMHVRTPVRVIQEPELAAPWRVLPGCDAAVAVDDTGAGLALAAAMAAGVPCVVPDSPRHRLRLRHGETALLASAPELRHLAGELQELIENPERAATLGDAARRSIEDGDGQALWLDAVERAKSIAINATSRTNVPTG